MLRVVCIRRPTYNPTSHPCQPNWAGPHGFALNDCPIAPQERDSSQLSSDQEALLRRCDELQAALGAKQEECALLTRKSAAVEEQWQAGRAATTALQVGNIRTICTCCSYTNACCSTCMSSR